MHKLKIIETFIKNTFRIIKGETYKDKIQHSKQYNSGGDDYNPPESTESIITTINNNETETIVFIYNDSTIKIANKGEKRIYSTDPTGKEINASIHLKNDGNIIIKSSGNIKLETEADVEITANNIKANASNIKATADKIEINGECELGGSGGKPVLTMDTIIQDSLGKPCSIIKPATKVKAF